MADRPNILLVLTDEERERAWFPDQVVLPNRERLAAGGMRFTNHHVHTIPCTPSRATILTGRHAASTGVFDNTNFSWQQPLHPSIPTLGRLLSDAGYRCAYLGKWHLGGESRRRGLAEYGFQDWKAPDIHGTPYLGHFIDGRIAAQAARWITRHAADDRPWLLVCSFVNPHDIMLYPRFQKPRVRDHGAELPPNFHDDLNTKPITQRYWRVTCDVTGGVVKDERAWLRLINAYVDLHLEVDRHLGTVLDSLAGSGAERNTVVVATSDHGDLAGAHGLRQKAANLYRENIQVPLTMSWPGTIPAGQSTERLSGAIDLVPTLLSVAAADPPPGTAREATEALPGRDLTPLWSEPDRAVRDSVLVTSDAFSSLGPAGLHRGFLRGVVTERHKYGRYFFPGEQASGRDGADLELYDRSEDPAELHNLAHPDAPGEGAGELIERLDRQLDDLIAAEIGADDVSLPLPDSRLAFLGGLWRRKARAQGFVSPVGGA
ncbi:MAG: sulfatase-like hydrolase/transferase [Mycolicibacterium sp.]|uniref:sulfatase-like hydrolase/transferase n=1 Tax=Mycolicibacterium sp. TaxID=2320850 RepID=UPI003D0B185D